MLRSQGRRLRVLFRGLVFPDSDWVRQVCSIGRTASSFDVLPVHAYPETWLPADVTVERYAQSLSNFVADADREC